MYTLGLRLIRAFAAAAFILMVLAGNTAYAHMRLDYPQGGEEFNAGDEVVIEWDAYICHTPDPGTLVVEFWPDGESANSYEIYRDDSFFCSEEAVGSYVWTVPNTGTTEARIRAIYDCSQSVCTYADTSAPFTIHRAPVQWVDYSADPGGNGLETNPYNQLQDAVENALSGDTVKFAAGSDGDETLMIAKALRLGLVKK